MDAPAAEIPSGLPELILPLRERILSRAQAPRTLSHYTDTHGLHGILESGRLLLSNAGFINDYTEILHGLQLFRESLERLAARGGGGARRKVLEKVLAGLPGLYASPSDIYVFSFCEFDDLLSQWRGYGRGPGAVSLGLDLAALRRIHPLFHPVPLLYEDEAKHELAERLVDAVLEGSADGEEPEPPAGRILGAARLLVPLFKNGVFAEEHEWRLVLALGERPPLFRVRGDHLLPYTEVQLPDFPAVVREIVVGPCENQERVRQSIAHYAQVRGIPARTRSSAIPLVP